MHGKERFQNLFLPSISGVTMVALGMAIVLGMVVAGAHAAQAQTYHVLYSFTGGQDGAFPYAGLTMDRAGNLYGTNIRGGYEGSACTYNGGCGTVFKLTNRGSGWVLTTLYSFTGSPDGDTPVARVLIGQDNSLYGTTPYGGAGHGILFSLRPAAQSCKAAVCRLWNEKVLYRFTGGSDGNTPVGELVSDQAGNLYGTTGHGGTGCEPWGCGIVYEMTHSGGGWIESVLYNFTGSESGYQPSSGLIFDSSGNLYGTTNAGGNGSLGTVYELTPSGSEWTETVLHGFAGFDGTGPSDLLLDQAGNVYGTTYAGGSGFGGTVFRLSPGISGWTFTVLYNFYNDSCSGWGCGGPETGVVMDAAGNLYGTTIGEGRYDDGTVFKLTPSNGGWTYSLLHSFSGGSDGGTPNGVLVDGYGNLYGTTDGGGAYGKGAIFEITP
jgi:uncharacterized repeat protein (TIGR03803 family)